MLRPRPHGGLLPSHRWPRLRGLQRRQRRHVGGDHERRSVRALLRRRAAPARLGSSWDVLCQRQGQAPGRIRSGHSWRVKVQAHDVPGSHVTFDCRAAFELSEWWKRVLGYIDAPDDPNEAGDEECMIVDPTSGHRLCSSKSASCGFRRPRPPRPRAHRPTSRRRDRSGDRAGRHRDRRPSQRRRNRLDGARRSRRQPLLHLAQRRGTC